GLSYKAYSGEAGGRSCSCPYDSGSPYSQKTGRGAFLMAQWRERPQVAGDQLRHRQLVMVEPAPAARAAARAKLAIAVSCAPVPVRSQIVTCVSLVRPVLLPATISPSSGAALPVHSPASIALRNSP